MLKKITINSIIIFILSIIIHGLYKALPFFPISIIAPVNESVAEHIKVVITPYLLFTIINYIYKTEKHPLKKNIKTAITNSFIFMIPYILIYLIFGYNTTITLILFFISLLVSNYIIEKQKEDNTPTGYYLLLITLIYIIIGYLTYFPPHIKIYKDEKTNTYGILNK